MWKHESTVVFIFGLIKLNNRNPKKKQVECNLNVADSTLSQNVSVINFMIIVIIIQLYKWRIFSVFKIVQNEFNINDGFLTAHVVKTCWCAKQKKMKTKIELNERFKLSISDDVMKPRSPQKHLFLHYKLLIIYAMC